MEDKIKKDLISVLDSALRILNEEYINPSELKELSNHTIENVSIYQDDSSLGLAILLYSLSKTIERVKTNLEYSKIKNLVKLAKEYLEDDNIESYHDFIKKIFDIISKTDTKFKVYIQEIVRQASIRKGGRIYEHGLSASKTAEVLGISLWELYNYVGQSNMSDNEKDISNLRKRLQYTRGLFQ